MRALIFCLTILSLAPLTAAAQDAKVEISIRAEQISDDFDYPVQVTSTMDEPTKLYIVERGGTVRVLESGKLLRDGLLDIEALVSSKQPHGLMGIAFPGDYGKSRIFYVNFMDPQGDTIIGRFPALMDDTADENALTVVVKLAQLFPNKNGSQIRFGSDGLLYISSGDGGGNHEHTEASQRLDSLTGKILRIDPSTTPKYTVPSDNPLQGQLKAFPEIWALGFRNPRQFSFDKDSGRMFLIDSHDKLDELNIIEKGKNYGWNSVLGAECARPLCDTANFQRPVFIRTLEASKGPMIGGVLYRGNKIAALRGKYIFADENSGQLYAAEEAPDSWKPLPILKVPGQTITSIGEDSQGEIFITTREGLLLAVTKL